jgi:hypothetical protein
MTAKNKRDHRSKEWRKEMEINSIRNDEKILKRIPLETVAVGFLIGLAAVPFFGPLAGLLVFAGGLFSALSFIQLRGALTRLLTGDRRTAVRSGIVRYFLRLTLLIGVFFIIIFLFSRMVLAFAAGFSAVIPVFLVEAAVALARAKQWKS